MGCGSSSAAKSVLQTQVKTFSETTPMQDTKTERSNLDPGTDSTCTRIKPFCETTPIQDTKIEIFDPDPGTDSEDDNDSEGGQNSDTETNSVLDDNTPSPKEKENHTQGATNVTQVKPVAKKKVKKVKGHSLEKDSAKLPNILAKFEEIVPRLLKLTDYATDECKSDLIYLRNQASLHRKVRCQAIDRLVELGIVEVNLRAWKQLFYLDYTELRVKTNISALLLLMLNGTDISLSMCQAIQGTPLPEMFFENLAHASLDFSLPLEENPPMPKVTDGEQKQQLDLSVNVNEIPAVQPDNDGEQEQHSTKRKKNTVSKNAKVHIIKQIMGICHNLLQKCDEVRERFRNADALNILQNYRVSTIKNQIVHCETEILLAYIVNEDENDLINSDQKNIQLLVSILASAMKSKGRRSRRYGYGAEELVEALNKLAVNDANKGNIVKAGVLKHYAALLQSHCTEGEQAAAARGVWTLSFTPEGKEAIIGEPGLVEALHQLEANSQNDDVTKAAAGALWILEDREKSVKSEKQGVKKLPHIMISYNWVHKPIATKIKDRLKGAGYCIWMDVENMSGSTLEAMAEAVEQSALVLICMSQKYKESPNCRTEAEYTYRLQKKFVPIKMEYRYNPDGWLGIMIGTKLWFDFGKEDTFETAMENLLSEIGKHGLVARTQDAVDRPMAAVTDVRPVPPGHVVVSQTNASVQSDVASWTNNDVTKWLKDNGLETLTKMFADFDGAVLMEYRIMMQTAPEAFYNSLVSKSTLPLADALKFTKALRALHH